MAEGRSATSHVSSATGVSSGAGTAEHSVLPGGHAGYVSTSLPGLQKSLNKLFAELQQGSSVYSRAASTNVLIPVGTVAGAGALEELIEQVARFHPSRFFIYGVNSKLSQVSAEVSARCHFTSKGGGKSQHVCSELVRIGSPVQLLPALAEVLRANLVTGTPTELLLYESEVDPALLQLALPLCDQLLLDSSMWISQRAVLESALVKARRAIDLQWVALGAWRDQVKVLFDVPAVRGLGSGVQKLHIECDAAIESKSGMPMCALLFAGWVANRLKLKLTQQRAGIFDLEGESGSAVRLSIRPNSEQSARAPKFLASSDAPEAKLRLVRFEGTGRGGKGVSIEIERKGELLEGRVRGERSSVHTRPIEDEGGEARLRRYFLIGESTANYAPAMQNALSLLKSVGT